MPAFKYIARHNGQIIGKRTSAAQRDYTHAIVSSDETKIVAWSGSLRLAQNEARRRGGLKIVPAERVDAYREGVTVLAAATTCKIAEAADKLKGK